MYLCSSKIIYITKKLPKSFVVCAREKEEQIYVSQLMPDTLFKRMKNEKHIFGNRAEKGEQ